MTLNTKLFNYQKTGVEKLKSLKIGALLMEMGTGKTRTALELVKIHLDSGDVEQVLWMCPCSVKENLKADLIKHCGEIPQEIKIYGIESISGSDRIYLEIMEYLKGKNTYLIVDESSLVKNPLAKRSKRIEKIAEQCEYKMILNGTPVTKNEADLFEQFMLLDWKILGYRSYYSFAANHLVYREINGRRTNQVIRVLNKRYLAEKIAPYSYQVKKSEVLNLKSKKCHEYDFQATSRQREIYNDVKYRYLESVDDFDSTTIYRLFTALQHVTSGREVISGPEEIMKTKEIFDDWEDNPRVLELRRCLTSIPESEQVIIFTKFDREVEEIESMLDADNKTYAIFTGKITEKKRESEMQRFQNGDTQYLISNKSAGAFGLNLQFCRNIVFYNNDFNFGTRSQAEDRIHRIGQTEDCNIYDIACKGTIDDMITNNLSKKENMLKVLRDEIKKMKEERRRKNAEDIQKTECV